MRLAILSDIHANLHALEAVWQDLEQQRGTPVRQPDLERQTLQVQLVLSRGMLPAPQQRQIA